MNFRNLIIPIFMLQALWSCKPESLPAVMGESPGTRALVSIDIFDTATKSILGPEVETVGSGAQLMVFFHDTGQLEGLYNLSSGRSSVEVTAGRSLDFYVIGNLWYISRSDGSKKGYGDLLGASFPTSLQELYDLSLFPSYSFDGKDVGGGLRTETFAEVKDYGIPYSGSVSQIVPISNGLISIPVRYMYSRVDVTIDHTGVDGGQEANFVNKKLYLRQANCRVHPFLPLKAESQDDVLEQSDYEATMTNARTATYTLYVPENRQIDLGFSNSDPSKKTEAELVSQGKGSIKSFLTYIELDASVDKSAGGYGGDFKYRFYLGKNNTDDFDLERNCSYSVTLSFKAGSLFEPYWKVEGSLDDTRKLLFAADRDGTRTFSDGQVLALRKSRPVGGSEGLYVYFNRRGVSGDNEASQYLDKWTDGYQPSDVTRSAFSYVFNGDLDANGITATYNNSTGQISVVVTDPSRFTAGKEFPLTLTLYPGGESTTVMIKTFDDINVSSDMSLDSWYVAMKRTMTVNGLAGSNITYRLSSADDVLKNTNSMSDAFLGTEEIPVSGKSLNFYAFKAAENQKLIIESDDLYNDGKFEFSFKIRKPFLRNNERFGTSHVGVSLCATGNMVAHGYLYKTDNNESVIYRSDFDNALYEQLLRPVLVPLKYADVFEKEGVKSCFGSRNTLFWGYEDLYVYINKPSVVGDVFKTVYRNTNIVSSAMSLYVPGDTYFYESRVPQFRIDEMFTLRSADGTITMDKPFSKIFFLNLWMSPGSIDFGGMALPELHDYSTISESALSLVIREKQSVEFMTEDVRFGVLDASDLNISIKPRSGYSDRELVLNAVFESSEEYAYNTSGRFLFQFRRQDMTHSCGVHEVYVSVVNVHSGEVVESILGTLGVHLYLPLVADFEAFAAGNDEVEIEFGGVLGGSSSNYPYGLLEAFNNDYKIVYEIQNTGNLDSNFFPAGQGNYTHNDTTISAEVNESNPVWQDNASPGTAYSNRYMLIRVNSKDKNYLSQLVSDRKVVMKDFFPRIVMAHRTGNQKVNEAIYTENFQVSPAGYIHIVNTTIFYPGYQEGHRGYLDEICD